MGEDKTTVLDFLNQDYDVLEVAHTLKLLRDFKNFHNMIEDLTPPFIAWTKLEQLEEYLAYKLSGATLRDDTLEFIKSQNFKLKERK